MPVQAVAFIPEIKLPLTINRSIKLAPGLFIIPKSHRHAEHIKNSIHNDGYSIHGGLFLYFKGDLRQDGTLYEIFQSFSLALTFFYEGRATCRAYQQIINKNYDHVEYFIDELDQFGIHPNDIRKFNIKDKRQITKFYKKISSQLASSEFNPLINALEFFSLFLRENRIRLRLLFLNICLESLIMAGVDSEGISYKLGMRIAYLLHKNDPGIDKNSTFIEVKNGYELRSKIIHGGDYKKYSQRIINKRLGKASSESDHVSILEEILKRLLKIIFTNSQLYNAAIKGELGNKVDQECLFV